MASQYESSKRTIGEMLSMTNPPIEVPEWQRNYSWTTTEVETFWLDLLGFSNRYPAKNLLSQEHFLGSVVLVLQPESHLLLDGQQRTATATILLSVIRDFVKDYRDDAAVRVAQRYIADYDDASDTHRDKLTLNRYDRDFFRLEIQERQPGDARAIPELKSHRLIREAREYFRQKFEEKYLELGRGEPAFRWALRIQQVLTDHMSVVVVQSEDEDNAASVFETLNDRGIGLSTPDLLRNLLMRRAQEEDRDEVIDCWQEVLEVEEDAKVEEFLRHYWLSKEGDVKTRRLYREIKDHVESANVDSLDFSRDLRRSAALYREIVSAREDNPGIAALLRDIGELGAKALLPAILSVYDAVADDENRIRLIRALLVFFVRHNLIASLENSKLETVVYRVAKELRDDEHIERAIKALRDSAPSDEQFKQQFEVARIGRQKSARYLLRQLEEDRRATEELEVAGSFSKRLSPSGNLDVAGRRLCRLRTQLGDHRFLFPGQTKSPGPRSTDRSIHLFQRSRCVLHRVSRLGGPRQPRASPQNHRTVR